MSERGGDVLVSVHAPILRSGRAVRTYGVARALAAAGGGVTFVYVRFGGDEPDAAHRAIPGIRFEAVEPSRGAAARCSPTPPLACAACRTTSRAASRRSWWRRCGGSRPTRRRA